MACTQDTISVTVEKGMKYDDMAKGHTVNKERPGNEADIESAGSGGPSISLGTTSLSWSFSVCSSKGRRLD